MASIHAPVSPKTLVWARKTSGVSGEQAAKKAGVDLARLHAWEAGDAQPSIPQLRNLADLYKRPLAFFFLTEVPKDFQVMKNFRRLPDSAETSLSPSLAIQLRQALVRRQLALDLAPEIGWEIEELSMRAKDDSDASGVAARVRLLLGVSLPVQEQWRDEREAFKTWRQAVERLGILTFQASRVSISEMRGMSAFFSRLPVILLNSADSIHGRIFTLAHELGHLVLRDEGVCDTDVQLTGEPGPHEVWCNEFAGSLLVPAENIEWRIQPGQSTGQLAWEQIANQASRFKVSKEVFLRRLLTTQRVSLAEYRSGRRHLQNTPARKKAKSKGGPAPDVKVVSNLGIPFVRAVLGAYHQQKITLSDVADYLDMRIRHLPKVQERVLRGEYEARTET